MGARLRAAANQALAAGWHAAAFARTRQMRPLQDYLIASDPQARAEEGAARVLAMLRAIKQKQEEQSNGAG